MGRRRVVRRQESRTRLPDSYATVAERPCIRPDGQGAVGTFVCRCMGRWSATNLFPAPLVMASVQPRTRIDDDRVFGREDARVARADSTPSLRDRPGDAGNAISNRAVAAPPGFVPRGILPRGSISACRDCGPLRDASEAARGLAAGLISFGTVGMVVGCRAAPCVAQWRRSVWTEGSDFPRSGGKGSSRSCRHIGRTERRASGDRCQGPPCGFRSPSWRGPRPPTPGGRCLGGLRIDLAEDVPWRQP